MERLSVEIHELTGPLLGDHRITDQAVSDFLSFIVPSRGHDAAG